MVKMSKRLVDGYKPIDKEKIYSLEEALDGISNFPSAKFDETVELHFMLTINPKNSDQIVRGTVVLPHGTGKKVRIAVFCKGELEQVARDAGADHVGSEDLIAKVSKGFLDFDVVVATPDMMRDLSKLGKVLGPRGLMPTPKSGTVTTDVAKAIKQIKAGKIEFKSDKLGGLHVGLGKKSFDKQQLLENAKTLIEEVNNARPKSLKGHLVSGVSLSTSMGPGLRVAL